jgi:hypothetical protein
MPLRRTQQSEVSEPAVPEAIKVDGSDEEIVHEADLMNVKEILDIANGKTPQSNEVSKTSDEKFVQYIGRATERQINSDEWPSGCEKNISAVWGFHNSFKVPAKVFSDSQLDYLLGDQDGGFKLVDGAGA